MSISNTPNRNYAWPEKDEDLESSNAFLRTTIFAIDVDVHALLTTKADIATTYTRDVVDTNISNAISLYDAGLDIYGTYATGDVRGSTELNLRTDTMAVPGAYSKVTVNDKGLVVAGTSATKTDISDFVEADYLHLIGTETASGDKTFSGTIVFSGTVTLPATATVDPSTIFDDAVSNSTTKGWTSDKITSELGSYVLASAYTDADVLAKLLNVDGAGTGLDADLLDAQHGAYYLDYTNFSNTPTLFDGAYASLSGLPTLFDGVFSSLTSVPTTVVGYGITDVYTDSEVDAITTQGGTTAARPIDPLLYTTYWDTDVNTAAGGLITCTDNSNGANIWKDANGIVV